MRAEAADVALARATALGASYADIRINRYRRESIATRERQVQNVSRSTSRGLGLRVLVNGAWGFAATNRVEPAAARAAAEQAVAIARANAALASRKVVLAHADKVVTTWTSAFKRDPFEVPLDTKIAFLMKLNETALAVAGVSFVSSQVLFVDEQKYFASSEGSRITQRLVRTYPQFSTTAANRASRRLPNPRRGRSRAARRLRVRRGLSLVARRREGWPRGRREAEVEAGRPPASTTSSSIPRSCSSPSTNRSATRPSSIARSAGKPTWRARASSKRATRASCASAPRS